MKAAPCSWRVVTWRTPVWTLRASRTSMVSSPGTENTYSQPSAARQSTRRWAAVRARVVVIGRKPSKSTVRGPPFGLVGQIRLQLVDRSLVAIARLVGKQKPLGTFHGVVAASIEGLLSQQPGLHELLGLRERRLRGHQALPRLGEDFARLCDGLLGRLEEPPCRRRRLPREPGVVAPEPGDLDLDDRPLRCGFGQRVERALRLAPHREDLLHLSCHCAPIVLVRPRLYAPTPAPPSDSLSVDRPRRAVRCVDEPRR